MVCLETSLLIDLLRSRATARSTMEELDSAGIRPTLTPVTAAEVWVGAEIGSSDEREAAAGLLASLTLLPFTRAAARRAGAIRTNLVSNGWQIGITDAMIAGIAIEHDESLVTRDEEFERIPGLRTRTY